MSACLFPGSFDPPTVGHMDLIRRLSPLFDEVIVCVMANGAKKPFLPAEQRAELLKAACRELGNVSCLLGEGFTVEMARKCGAGVIARGVRNTQDYEYESRLAKAYAYVDDGTETLLMLAKPEHEGLSSSVVREIFALGGDVSKLVPDVVLEAMKKL